MHNVEGEPKWGPRYARGRFGRSIHSLCTLATIGTPSVLSHRYTAADLDRLIGYKIYPDSRTRLVEGHKVAQEDKKAGGGPGGRFGRMFKKKDGDATTEAVATIPEDVVSAVASEAGAP